MAGVQGKFDEQSEQLQRDQFAGPSGAILETKRQQCTIPAFSYKENYLRS
jgi:hypothetical protein